MDLLPAYHTEEEHYRCGGCHRDDVGPGGGYQERYPRCGHEANKEPYYLVDVHGLTLFPLNSEDLEPGALYRRLRVPPSARHRGARAVGQFQHRARPPGRGAGPKHRPCRRQESASVVRHIGLLHVIRRVHDGPDARVIALMGTAEPDPNQRAASASARVAQYMKQSVGSTQWPGLSESRLGRLRSPPSGADKRGRSPPGKGTAVYGVRWAKSTGSP